MNEIKKHLLDYLQQFTGITTRNDIRQSANLSIQFLRLWPYFSGIPRPIQSWNLSPVLIRSLIELEYNPLWGEFEHKLYAPKYPFPPTDAGWM